MLKVIGSRCGVIRKLAEHGFMNKYAPNTLNTFTVLDIIAHMREINRSEWNTYTEAISFETFKSAVEAWANEANNVNDQIIEAIHNM